MHLSKCIDLISTSAGNDYTTSKCVKDWILKSTTEFHGWDDRLELNSLFGLLCWSYTLAGVVMLIIQPSWTARSEFLYQFAAFVLIFIQGWNQATCETLTRYFLFAAFTHAQLLLFPAPCYLYSYRTFIILG